MPAPAKPFPVALVIGLVLGVPAVLCLLGVLGSLATVAIPAFTRYVKRSKTAEATANIARIYQAEVAYYNASSERGAPSFVGVGATPASPPSAMKYPGDSTVWTNDVGWSALGFSIATPHYYQYQVVTGPNSFTVTAIGNLDGDLYYSTFSRTATISNGQIEGSPLQITNELE